MLIGGFNIEDDYFGTADEGAWRDIGLMVEGPAAARLAPYYDELMGWAQTKGARIRGTEPHHPSLQRDHGKLQWNFGGPMRGLSPWALRPRAICCRAAMSR